MDYRLIELPLAGRELNSMTEKKGSRVLDVAADLMIRNLVARFANSFDLKAWDALGDCLTESLHTDYSDLRGTPPEIMSRGHFVEIRKAALQKLRTHHLTGNVDVSVHGDSGVATVSMVIFRRSLDEETFTSHCVYELGVAKENDCWRISSIVQRVLWSAGNSTIHSGIVNH
jgi:hypothetical protein